MNIKDKVIVITGGGRGLGKAFALDLADRGAKLALADVDQENLDSAWPKNTQVTDIKYYFLNFTG